MEMIFNNTIEPSLNTLVSYVEGDANERLKLLINNVIDKLNPKVSIHFSKCTAIPGWNIKLKHKSKALLTIYPRKDIFLILLVLNPQAVEVFDMVKEEFTPYTQQLVGECELFNNTKWLVITVSNEEILKDVIKLLSIKLDQ